MKSKIGTVEEKMKAIHSHNLNYWVWGLPHPPPTSHLHFLNLVKFKPSLSLNILLNIVLVVALRLIVINKNITRAVQITAAAPFCTRGLEYRLGPGGSLSGGRVILLHFLGLENIQMFLCLYAKWKLSVRNAESKNNHHPPSTIDSWHLPCSRKSWEMF